jgi:tRNA(fMet)-specific endonuclease VapC
MATPLSLLPVVPLPEEAATAYGEIRAALEEHSEMIGSNDLCIAAHAKSAGLAVVTNNEREFKRVPGLKLQNWISRRRP